MQHVQRSDRRFEQPQRLLKPELPAALRRVNTQIDAGYVFHDDIRRAVFDEAVLHRHHAGVVVEPRDLLRFAEKAFASFKERLLVLPGEHAHGALPLIADHNAGGEVFLDGYRYVQKQIPADIRDAEAALAQRTAHQILSLENGTRRQMVLFRNKISLYEAAHGTRLLLIGLARHTAHAQFPVFHVVTSPFTRSSS